MRIAVLILAILGSLGSGGVGVLWLWHTARDSQGVELGRMLVEQAGVTDSAMRKELAEYDRRAKTFGFLLAGFALGLVGGVLAMLGRGKSAAALLLTAVIGPAVLHPVVLIFTFLLAIAGVLALFVRPRRVALA
jgi:hypothetical protein